MNETAIYLQTLRSLAKYRGSVYICGPQTRLTLLRESMQLAQLGYLDHTWTLFPSDRVKGAIGARIGALGY